MKYIIILFITYTTMVFSLNADDMHDKQNNEKILNSLLFLNSLYSGESHAVSNECKTQIYNLLLEYDNPLEVARLMVLSNYMIRKLDGENRISNIFSALTEGYGMQRLKSLKVHPDFTEAMLFIERSIKLDAGVSYMFSEAIWDARDIDGIKKHFKERIKQWAIGIRKYGTQADKDILKEYEVKNANMFK